VQCKPLISKRFLFPCFAFGPIAPFPILVSKQYSTPLLCHVIAEKNSVSNFSIGGVLGRMDDD
jgi:hypothetical protein